METVPLLHPPGRPLRLGPSSPPSGLTAAILLGSGGLLIVLGAAGAPLGLLAVPAAIVGTMAAIARPALGLSVILALSGFIGTLIAFTGLPVGPLSELGLLCLLLASVYIYATGQSQRRTWLWPALILPGLYLLLTTVQMFTSESLDYAFQDYRITTWYMAAIPILALGPWDSRTYRRAALGFVAIAALVGLYAVYRHIVGPSPEEFAQARGAVQRIAFSVPTRFFGSFLSAFQLAAWCGTALPFLLAIAFVTKGLWRVVGIVAMGGCLFAVFASDVRTGIVAVAVGMGLVLVLFLMSQAFQIERFAMGFLALLGVGLAGIGGYALLISDSETESDRFSRILTPGEDPAFENRLIRWEEALDVIDREPFGHGLGTQGYVGQSVNEEGETGPFNLDSAYLKVGIQQGYLMMVLFVASLIVLAVSLGRRSLLARDRWACALGIGACGALVAQMIFFFSGIYSEGVTALSAWVLVGMGAAQFTALDPDRKSSVPRPATHA